MKISIVCHLLFPGQKYLCVAYPVDSAYWLMKAVSNAGHIIQLVNASDPIDKVIIKLRKFKPDLIFNLGEGLSNSEIRQAFFPELYGNMGFSYVGSSAYTLSLTLNKFLSKNIASGIGIKTPPGNFYFMNSKGERKTIGNWTPVFPAIVKPNYEGDSEGITQDSIVTNKYAFFKKIESMISRYPKGILAEQLITGSDFTVSYLEGLGKDGVLEPLKVLIDNKKYKNPYNIKDYYLKNYAVKDAKGQYLSHELAKKHCPKNLITKLKRITKKCIDVFKINSFARVDFRVTGAGEIYFLEVNALPTMVDGTEIFSLTNKKYHLNYSQTLEHIIKTAAKRNKVIYSKYNKIKKMELKNILKYIAYRLNKYYYRFRYEKIKYKEI